MGNENGKSKPEFEEQKAKIEKLKEAIGSNEEKSEIQKLKSRHGLIGVIKRQPRVGLDGVLRLVIEKPMTHEEKKGAGEIVKKIIKYEGEKGKEKPGCIFVHRSSNAICLEGGNDERVLLVLIDIPVEGINVAGEHYNAAVRVECPMLSDEEWKDLGYKEDKLNKGFFNRIEGF